MFQTEADNPAVIDITTPCNALLSAFYKRSFAHYTVKERMPRILTQQIDTLVRHKDDIGNEFGKDAKEELKSIIGELSKLKYEIQTNKAIRSIESTASDVPYYNDYLRSHPNITHFTAVWLYTEAHMYRRIHEIFELSTHLKDFDCFQIHKRESYHVSTKSMEQVASYLLSLFTCNGSGSKEAFIKLLKLNLWGNKADLSFSDGQVESSEDPFEMLQSLEPNILCDWSESVWEAVSNMESKSRTIDIVLDNAGYELFTDLCLVDFILTNNLAENVRLYVKTCPYFISDATKNDLNWTLKEMNNTAGAISKLGERWTKYIEENRILIVEDDYWITALDYSVMRDIKPQLYKKLSEAKLIIFKGDLNYRKLIGEKNWNPTAPFDACLQGFCPAKLCTLRTLKCGVVCGLKKSVVDDIEKRDAEWKQNGNYGVIQYSDCINVLT